MGFSPYHEYELGEVAKHGNVPLVLEKAAFLRTQKHDLGALKVVLPPSVSIYQKNYSLHMSVQSAARPDSVPHKTWEPGVTFNELLGSKEACMGICNISETNYSFPMHWSVCAIVLEGHLKLAEIGAPGVVHDLPVGSVFHALKGSVIQFQGRGKAFFRSDKPFNEPVPKALPRF